MSHLDDRLINALTEPQKGIKEMIIESMRYIFAGILFSAICISGFYFLFTSRAHKENDFIAFEALKHEFQAQNDSQIKQLEGFGKKYPELKMQIEHLMAKTCIENNKMPEALLHAEKLLSSASEKTQVYQDFSRTSLLIEEGSFPAALKAALDLKTRLLSNAKESKQAMFAQILLFNQLRIALMYRELGKVQEELMALEELNGYLSQNEQYQNFNLPAESMTKFQKHLQSGQVSLLDFISMRQKTLSPQPT
ncbi:MAG: DUF2225 domain-containing protein [Simkaniaceae bacterium]|nr:DUF2225 domain-containing protein [Simkaniaceae bacterium]MCF7851814.1 DUF2225 domain-containing protein [Simkaniaceae bacterium]